LGGIKPPFLVLPFWKNNIGKELKAAKKELKRTILEKRCPVKGCLPIMILRN